MLDMRIPLGPNIRPQTIFAATQDMLAAHDWDYFVTASLHKVAGEITARNALKDWHQRIDRKLLGGRYQRKKDKRTLFFAFLEGGETNLHWHMMLKLGCEKRATFDDVASVAWKHIVPSGTIDIQQVNTVHDRKRASSYSSKFMNTDRSIENFVVSSQFQ